MSSELPRPETLDAVSRLTSARAVEWRAISGGYSSNRRWLVDLDDGRTLFAKEAVDADTARWLDLERKMYEALDAGFMPEYFGWDATADYPVLFIEDLSNADWPPPWTSQRIDRIKDTIREINGTKAPDFVGSLEAEKLRLSGWYEVTESPDGLSALGVASSRWLAQNLSTLADAEAAATWGGNDLLHLDIRSDNLCFVRSRVKVVDWNLAKVGNGAYDLLFWLPSLHLEGGPTPWDVTLDEPEMIAAIAGFFARQAPKPDPWKGSRVRQFQLQQLRVALPWACRAIGIEEPLRTN